jgi:hypothetical protein
MRIVKVASIALASAFVAHAVFTQWYETGWARVTSPVLFILFAYVFIVLALRNQWAWKIAMFASMATTIINLAFFPSPKFFGSYTDIAKYFAVIEITLSAWLWILIPKESTKAWLSESRLTSVSTKE